MADLPIAAAGDVRRLLLRYVDVEGKVPRTLEALGPLAGRDVVLLDADEGLRARQLADLGGRVVALTSPERLAALRRRVAGTAGAVVVAAGEPSATGLPTGSADVVVGFWSCLRPDGAAEHAEADRLLRPGGRLLAVHDYAQDDVSGLFPPSRARELVSWSRRDGWFLGHGFKIRVIHAFWTFPDLETMRAVVEAAFGSGAQALIADRLRPRLSWKVVVYHRARDGLAGSP